MIVRTFWQWLCIYGK